MRARGMGFRRKGIDYTQRRSRRRQQRSHRSEELEERFRRTHQKHERELAQSRKRKR